MNLFNLNTIKIEKLPFRKTKTKEITINCKDILNKTYTEYTSVIDSQIAQDIKDICENTVFNIKFITDSELEIDDIEQFYLYSVSSLCNILASSEKREREERLSVNTNGLYINYNTLLKLINYQTLINNFTINFIYKNTTLQLIGG